MSTNSIPISWLNGSEDEKKVLAKRVSRIICNGSQEKEIKVAESIARVLLNDLSQEVRETLSFELRNCPSLSQAIAHKIAIDVENVAGPFLEISKAFTDEHLEKLIPIVKEFARMSIAKREHVSEGVGVVLVEFSSDETVTVLMQNTGAEMGKKMCDKMVERYEGSHPNMEMLATRIDLPAELVQELKQKISSNYMATIDDQYFTTGSITDHLNYWVNDPDINRLMGSRDQKKIEEQVTKLNKIGLLTPTVILSNLQHGNTLFFEVSMTVLTDASPENIHRLMSHGGIVGIDRLLLRANIPKAYWKQFRSELNKAYRKT